MGLMEFPGPPPVPTRSSLVSARLIVRPVPWDAVLAIAAGERLEDWAPDYPSDGERVVARLRQRLAAVLASALPGTTAEKILPFTLHIFLHVPGLWTFCYPRPDSEKLLNESKYRHLKLDFRREMTLFLQALLKEAVAA